jgi:hypothetical protein
MASKYTCLSAFITAMMFFILFCTMVAQKVLQHFLFFSQNKQEMSATYSVVKLECPVCYCSNLSGSNISVFLAVQAYPCFACKKYTGTSEFTFQTLLIHFHKQDLIKLLSFQSSFYTDTFIT